MAIAETIREAIDKAERILVITHVGPDGDALGSLTAVGIALTQQGKEVTLICDDFLPHRFDFLPMWDRIRRTPEDCARHDLIIVVDCGDELRMGQIYVDLPQPHPRLINIDHHITNTRFGEINHIDANAVSTTEILFKLFADMGYPLTVELAVSLLTGLVTDTLGFRTTGVTAETLKIAGALVEAGADLPTVTVQTLNLKPMSTLLLWRIGLSNMKFEDGLVWAAISNEERKAIGHTSSSSSGLVNLMSNVDEAAIGAVLLEMEDGSIRVGFRCRPPYSVSELAQNLGGGGHALASGCTLEGPLDKAEALVVELTKQTIRQQEAIISDGHR
ncbi:MAG: bifunctional oligoribonuclease/PAP phosphatase NrnA [Anaerolineae bacterium]